MPPCSRCPCGAEKGGYPGWSSPEIHNPKCARCQPEVLAQQGQDEAKCAPSSSYRVDSAQMNLIAIPGSPKSILQFVGEKCGLGARTILDFRFWIRRQGAGTWPTHLVGIFPSPPWGKGWPVASVFFSRGGSGLRPPKGYGGSGRTACYYPQAGEGVLATGVRNQGIRGRGLIQNLKPKI